MAGTWAALILATLALAVFGCAAVAVTAALSAGAYGVDTRAWWTTEGLTPAVGRTVGVALALAGFTTAGVLVAVIVRSPIIAIGVGLAYGLFEGLAAATLGPVAGIRPGQLLASVSRGAADPAFATAVPASLALIVACLAIAAVTLRSRDITD